MRYDRSVWIWTLAVGMCFVPSSRGAAQAVDSAPSHAKQADDAPVEGLTIEQTVLWRDPGPITQRDLFYGQGGKDRQPAPPFKFESEDLHGTNPKFDARDADGTKWRVKLGDEARPEVVTSRLMWAVGYFVNDDYALASAQVDNVELSRGASLVSDGHIVDARFERKPDGEKKIGIWRWKQNPYTGTRELNGLRVMMAVVNNWDLKDVNNAVFEDQKSGKDILLVSDVGATFGTNGLSWSKGRSKGDASTFRKSKFIIRKTNTEVDFATPAAPNPVIAPNVAEYKMRHELEWIGKKIPLADARWIGSLLKQLSHEQLVDAFRAGQFRPDEIEGYVRVLESRIHELAAL